MNDLLISQQEVIDRAITKVSNFNAGNVQPLKILAAEEKHILPVLTLALYTKLKELVSNGQINKQANAKYQTLHEKVKDSLAYFVKYEVAPDISVQMTNLGAMQNRTNHSGQATAGELKIMMQNALSNGQSLLNIAVRYVEQEGFDEYSQGTNVRSSGGFQGGIIFG